MNRSAPPVDPQRNRWLGALRRSGRQAVDWVARNIPPGVRLVLGLLLVAGGVLGFLPVLGFWMIPLGIAVAAIDIRGLWNLLRTGLGRRR